MPIMIFFAIFLVTDIFSFSTPELQRYLSQIQLRGEKLIKNASAEQLEAISII